MDKARQRCIILAIGVFILGLASGIVLHLLVFPKVSGPDGENDNPNVRALSTALASVKALYNRDYGELSSLTGSEGLRFVAFSTVTEGDQVFTREQVKNFANDQKVYIFGIDAADGSVIERQPSEFINEYCNIADFSLVPQIALNRVIKTGNSVENVLEFYPAPEYTVVDFYYPPSESKGIDWLSLKVVLRQTEKKSELVAIVRGVYTAQ